jgi:hypothetical protein
MKTYESKTTSAVRRYEAKGAGDLRRGLMLPIPLTEWP